MSQYGGVQNKLIFRFVFFSNTKIFFVPSFQCLKLSASAAQLLSDAGEINMDTLDLHRPKEYDPRKPVSDPLSGGGTAIFWTITHYYAGIAEIF